MYCSNIEQIAQKKSTLRPILCSKKEQIAILLWKHWSNKLQMAILLWKQCNDLRRLSTVCAQHRRCCRWWPRKYCFSSIFVQLPPGSVSTHETQDRRDHPGYRAVQLRLTCDQIRTGSESLHVKYGAKEKMRNTNNWEPCQHARSLASNQHWNLDIFYVLSR